MQMLGGASDRVPTVSTPGVPSPRAPVLTVLRGCTVAVVYLSSSGPLAAAARLVGRALALSGPGGAHWSTSAPAGPATDRLTTSRPISANANALPILRVNAVIHVNVAATGGEASASAQSERNWRGHR